MTRLVYEPEVTMLWQSNLIEGEQGMIALEDAMAAWDYLMGATERAKLTHEILRETHSILMRSPYLRYPLQTKWQGFYRTIPVYIGGIAAMHHSLIEPELTALFARLNDTRNVSVSDEAREIHARTLHVRYEKIHPFVDGNGRTGRMLYNWHRLALGLPVDVINVADRMEYYKWFTADEKGSAK